MANDRKQKILARLRRKLDIPSTMRRDFNLSASHQANLARASGVSPNPCPHAEPLGFLAKMPHESLCPSSNKNVNSLADIIRLQVSSSYVYPVEVKSAGNMGNGVFVTRDVKEGELLCFYDGICCLKKEHANIVSGKLGYYQDTSSGFLSGFQTQLRPGGCGQLINDASNDLSTYGNDEYWTKINTIFDPAKTVFGCYAKRDIRRGEQLFHHYGEDYWKTITKEAHENFDLTKLPEIKGYKCPTGLELDDYCQRLRYCSLLPIGVSLEDQMAKFLKENDIIRVGTKYMKDGEEVFLDINHVDINDW